MPELFAGAGREPGLEQNLDLAASIAPDKRVGVPVESDVVETLAADQGIVVAERDFGLREHDSKLRVVPVDLKSAQEFVAAHHRHHEPPIGHKFSVGVARDGVLVGVAIIGRPVSRAIQSEGATLEVIRSATDGTRNANSMLYGAARRAAFALGYAP